MMKALFRDRKVNLAWLLAYGFVPVDGAYVYTVELLDGQFMMTVTVTPESDVAARVVDTACGEEYVLHRVAASSGSFVGSVREAYEAVLQEIVEKCFERDVFKSEQARLVIEYVRERYQRELEYLWTRFPRNAVWRRADNAKWFGALLTVSRCKLGLEGDEIIEIIDLRMPTADLEKIVDGERYFPGYHMNKRHWVTICLDGSVPVEEICECIDRSYSLAAKK